MLLWPQIILMCILLSCLCKFSDLHCVFQLMDSDQELYKNFPLVISERWQQEVAETVYEAVNSDTDKAEARKRAKNKQQVHEEGNALSMMLDINFIYRSVSSLYHTKNLTNLLRHLRKCDFKIHQWLRKIELNSTSI